MALNFYTTNQLSPDKFDALIKSFNEVFELSLPKEYFTNYFFGNPEGKSYHVLFEDGDTVAGALTVIPLKYKISGQHEKVGLVIGAFILEEYRSDILMLKRIYDLMKKNIYEYGIKYIYALPNDNVYQYWKAVVKWKDIAQLDYYIHPVNITNLKGISFTPVNRLVSSFMNLPTIINPKKTDLGNEIMIERNDAFAKARTKDAEVVHFEDGELFYRIHIEKGVRVAYIIDFSPHNLPALEAGIRRLSRERREDIDLIVLIGLIKHPPRNTFKLPKKFEPRKLYFCGSSLAQEELGLDYFDKNNWQIELFNFDVK